MFMKTETFDPWSGPATAAFQFWVSFWPTAPLFGVEWRYADTVFQFGPMAAAPAAKPAKTVKPVKAAKPAPAVEPETVVAETVAVETVAVETVEAKAEAPAPVVEAVAEPAPAAEPTPAADPSGRPASLLAEAPADADDLTRIKGIGAGMAKQLNGLGIYKLAQLAAFSPAELAWLDENLNGIKGALYRADWAGQAKALIG